MAGKNKSGTARPGNNSGVFIFKGSDIEIGITIRAKERIDRAKLKTNSAFLFSHFTSKA